MDHEDQKAYLEAIKHNVPIGAGHALMNLATTIAMAHGTDVARGLFADIASIDTFWEQIDTMKAQIHGAERTEKPEELSQPSAEPGPAAMQIERRSTVWEIVDLTEGRIVHTFEGEEATETEALDRGARVMGFSTFAAACETVASLRGRVRARRRGEDFQELATPSAAGSLESLASAAPQLAEQASEAVPVAAEGETHPGAVVLGNVHELAGVLPKKGKGKRNGAPQ